VTTRTRISRIPLQRQLRATILLVTGVAILLASIGFLGYEVYSFRSAMVRDLDTLAEMIGSNSTGALVFDDAGVAQETLSALAARSSVESAFLLDASGERFAQFTRDGVPDGATVEARTWERDGSVFDGGRLISARTITMDGERLGRVVLISDMGELTKRLRRYASAMGAILAVTALIAVFLAAKLQRALTRPIRQLSEAARSVTERRDYSLRVGRCADDEVGVLTDAFNGMLEEIELRDEALQATHDHLELQVEERTAELRRQIDEREQAEQALEDSEEKLRQSQKMESIGRLAGGVAHDFNNLLTVINGYSQLMVRRLKSGDPLRDNATEVLKAGERASALTGQLLAFSRKQILSPRVIDLGDTIRDMGRMLERLIGEGISLQLELGDDPAHVRADLSQIEQVIMNLAINAKDAMDGRGTLRLILHEHDSSDSGACVELEVRDSGCGIDPDTLAQIFEPFFTTKESGKGTGLGLSTVYGIVRQSGGDIEVESEPSQGTVFRVRLPKVDAPLDGDATPIDDSTSIPSGQETVLLVEDEAMVRQLTGDILEELGYRILEASNGGEALLACERHAGPIDLMLSDVVMPQMSGPELLERVNELRPHTKVLFMSGYSEEAVSREGAFRTGVPLLKKPFSPDHLARKVREVLEAAGGRGSK